MYCVYDTKEAYMHMCMVAVNIQNMVGFALQWGITACDKCSGMVVQKA